MTSLCSDRSRSYPGRPASLQGEGLARKPGTDRRKPVRAMQESAAVVVPPPPVQGGREGPNDEEQGRVLPHLVAREPLADSVLGRCRPDHRLTVPTGTNRHGAAGETRLELACETLTEPSVADPNGRRRTFPNAFAHELELVRRTAVCGPACTVVWGGRSEMTALTRFGETQVNAGRFEKRSFARNCMWPESCS